MPLPRILVGVMTGQSFCRSLENIENSRIPASQKVVFRHLPHGPAQSSPGPRVLTVGCGATSRGNNARPLPSVPRSCFQDGYFYPNHRILFLGSLWAAFPQAPPGRAWFRNARPNSGGLLPGRKMPVIIPGCPLNYDGPSSNWDGGKRGAARDLSKK